MNILKIEIFEVIYSTIGLDKQPVNIGSFLTLLCRLYLNM